MTSHQRHLRGWSLVLAALLGLLAGVTLVWAFAEEPLGFRDPNTNVTYSAPEISTIHDDLTYVLALAAGYSITDAKTLQIWDQLVDSEALPGAVVSYTNGGGAFYPAPDPDSICVAKPHANVIWPLNNRMVVSTSVSSRYGPYSPYFHFPHLSGPYANRDIGALHDWAWGITNTLVAYEAYAWGGPLELTVMQASCLYTRMAVITTPIQPGSLEAFATYLHSLGDGYSHRDCIAAMDALGKPWATHTTPADLAAGIDVPACFYKPNDPTSTDVHGREFFTYTDSLRTDAAIRAIYGELVARSLQREGLYFPIGLDTPISGAQTLSDTLSIFVHQWDYDHPTERRNYADQLAVAVQARRQAMNHVYLPVIVR
jgi:hypothetical protein